MVSCIFEETKSNLALNAALALSVNFMTCFAVVELGYIGNRDGGERSAMNSKSECWLGGQCMIKD